MTFAQRRTLPQRGAHIFRQLQKPQAVGQRRGAAPEAARQFLLRKPMLAEDGAAGFSLVQIVQVLPLYVFHQRHQAALEVIRRHQHAGGALPAQQAQGAQPALAGHDRIAVSRRRTVSGESSPCSAMEAASARSSAPEPPRRAACGSEKS